MGQQSKLIKL